MTTDYDNELESKLLQNEKNSFCVICYFERQLGHLTECNQTKRNQEAIILWKFRVVIPILKTTRPPPSKISKLR